MTNEKIKTKESSIDLMMTGQVMKREIKKKGYTVRELQKKLGLSTAGFRDGHCLRLTICTC